MNINNLIKISHWEVAGDGWDILINTELPLADERAPFVFPRLPNTHQQIQLTQVRDFSRTFKTETNPW